MVSQTELKKRLLDQFDDEFFGPNPPQHNQTLNRVGKVNVGWNENFLKSLPAYDVLVDVGAADDFHTLHAARPEAYSVLIDANANYKADYEKFLETRHGEYHICAVGECEKIVQYTRYKTNPYYSTTQHRGHAPDGDVEHINVKVRKIDSLVPFDRIRSGALMKLDIEGSELEALNGSSRLLAKTNIVICEMSLDAGFPGGESFHSIYTKLVQAGFSLRDIIRVPRVEHNTFPAQVIDGVFTR